jgi:hypothetical protein
VEKRLFAVIIKKLNKNETIIGLFVFIISIYIYIESIHLPDFGKSYESPGLLPAFIAVCMFVLSIFLIAEEIKKALNLIKEENKGSGEDATINREPLWDQRIIMAIVIIIIYIIILPNISFLGASILFLFAIMSYLKAGNFFLISMISLLIPIGIQYLFANVFQQLIP